MQSKKSEAIYTHPLRALYFVIGSVYVLFTGVILFIFGYSYNHPNLGSLGLGIFIGSAGAILSAALSEDKTR